VLCLRLHGPLPLNKSADCTHVKVPQLQQCLWQDSFCLNSAPVFASNPTNSPPSQWGRLHATQASPTIVCTAGKAALLKQLQDLNGQRGVTLHIPLLSGQQGQHATACRRDLLHEGVLIAAKKGPGARAPCKAARSSC
jgi:hypothetical protein